MLYKIFAGIGILAAIIVVIIGIDVFFVGFDDTPFSKNQEAQKETSLLVTKVNKDKNELILLIKIKNNSEKVFFCVV